MSGFTHLHVHTQYSALESTVQIDALLEKCKELGMSAVAMTDHGNLCGAIDFFNAAKKAKIKPIFGCDIYLAADAESKEAYRLLLLAKDRAGFQNLSDLISRSYLEGLGDRPVIQKSWLEEKAEGLFILAGGMKSEIGRYVLTGQMEKADAFFAWAKAKFGKSFYATLQVNGLAEQDKLNQWLVEKCEKEKVGYLATSDVHYLLKEDASAHEILACTKLGRTISDPLRRNLCSEYWFKDAETIAEQFSAWPTAIENTQKIADACNVEFKFTDEKGRPIYYLPNFQIPPEEKEAKSVEDYLRVESERGLRWRFEQPGFASTRNSPEWPELEKQYWARLDDEIKMIQKTGFSGYFLIVSDFIRWAKDQDIPVGPGRGSGAGSSVAWALRIIDIDPLPYNLLFERFINPERISMPDFDVDFCMDRRGEVIEYVRQKYGKEQVSQIITYGKLQTKQCIRDSGRVLGMSYGEVDQLSKLVPDRLGITLEEALAMEPKFAEMRAANPLINLLFEHALKLEGLVRSFGKHAGGVIITDKPIANYSPLLTDEEGAVVTQYDKDAAEMVGLVKFDFLGLKTLTHIQFAVKLVNENLRSKGEAKIFRIEDIGVYDKDAYALIAKGDTNGVFQVESGGMVELCKKLAPSNLEELTWINALYRPGPLESGMVDDFIDRKHGRIKIEYPLPQLEDVLKETLGVFIYQEQVMRAARVLAGYSLGEADLLRRAMGKKKPEEMAAQKDRFVKGALAQGISEAQAAGVFDLMEKFSGYGFNKSHATAYAYVSFQTAYLKAHHPAAFYAALLTTELSDTDKLARYIADAKDHNIPVLGPDVNESDRFFNVVTVGGQEQIRFGLEAIKGVGGAAVGTILEERAKGPFRSFPDFCKRVALRKVNKKTLETLIRTGAFDSLYKGESAVNRATLAKAMEAIMAWAGKEQERESLGQAGLFDGLFSSAGNGPMLKAPEPELPFQPEWSHMQKLEAERELLGFYVSGHPLDPYAAILKKCASHSVARVMELAAEGKIVRRGPEDWKAKKAARDSEPSLGGIISATKEITTKKGDRMAFLTVEDFTGKMEVVCFPRCYEKDRDAIATGRVVVVSGQLEPTEGGAKMLASSVVPLESISQDKLKSVKLVTFRLDAKQTTKKQLEHLRLLCIRNKGNCLGVLEFIGENGELAKLPMPDDMRFSADTIFAQEVKEIFGRDVLTFHS